MMMDDWRVRMLMMRMVMMVLKVFMIIAIIAVMKMRSRRRRGQRRMQMRRINLENEREKVSHRSFLPSEIRVTSLALHLI